MREEKKKGSSQGATSTILYQYPFQPSAISQHRGSHKSDVCAVSTHFRKCCHPPFKVLGCSKSAVFVQVFFVLGVKPTHVWSTSRLLPEILADARLTLRARRSTLTLTFDFDFPPVCHGAAAHLAGHRG